MKTALYLLAVLQASQAFAAPCASNRILNGKCIRPEQATIDCAQFTDAGLQRTCLEFARQTEPQPIFAEMVSRSKNEPERCEEDVRLFSHELNALFPAAERATAIPATLASCREVVEKFKESGIRVDAVILQKKYGALRDRIQAVHKTVQDTAKICSTQEKGGDPIIESADSFPALEKVTAISVEKYFDGSVYRLPYAHSVEKLDASKNLGPQCKAAAKAMTATYLGTHALGYALTGYAFFDSNTSPDTNGTIFNPGGMSFKGVPKDLGQTSGAGFFKTYSECHDLLEFHAIANFHCPALGPNVNSERGKKNVPRDPTNPAPTKNDGSSQVNEIY